MRLEIKLLKAYDVTNQGDVYRKVFLRDLRASYSTFFLAQTNEWKALYSGANYKLPTLQWHNSPVTAGKTMNYKHNCFQPITERVRPVNN